MGKRYDAAMRVKPFLQKGAQSLGDDEALEIKSIYPEWESCVEYTTRKKARYKGKLYRCLQAHTSQDAWTPDVSASLWTVIDEEHKGTVNDPIPYSGNMALEQGKYYEQGGVVYLCIRDSINPLNAALSELVGVYVQACEDN